MKPSTRRGFAASPMNTATAGENQRIETRHVGASKGAFRARPPPPIFRLRSSKIDVFLRVFLRTDLKIDVSREASADFHHMSQKATLATGFDGICTLSPLRAVLTTRFAKNTQHDTSKVLCLPCKMTEVSRVLRLPRKIKCNASSANVAKVSPLPPLPHKTTFYETRWNVTKCHACQAK